MRIAVMSDVRLPTSWAYPGHGLGKNMLLLAEGLAERGHTVLLLGGEKTRAQVPVCVGKSEEELARLAFEWEPDVVLDGSHSKAYSRLYAGAPVVS